METEGDLVDVRISVSAELKEHYEKILKFRDEIYADRRDSDPKDVIRTLQLVTGIIRELKEIQDGLYNSETNAVLQRVIVEELKNVSPELRQRVLDAFDQRLLEMK